jgi:SAM-dependent methyltransferase
MNETQRKQVTENAKYLREVRPIDPEEIQAYIEGTPHPAAVRQVLREQATELGVIEREDGCFEPVNAEPISVPFHGVERLPEELTRTVENMLIEQFGPGWPDGESGEQLRAVVRDFKQQYLAGGAVTYDEVTALGYVIYHLPPYYAASQYVLSDLVDDGLVPGHLRVLDVGAGVGGPALGLDALLPTDTLVEYHAVEPSEAGSVLTELLDATGRNFHPAVHSTRIEEFDPKTAIGSEDEGAPEFDLALFGNVLSELAEPERILTETMEWLAPDGTVVAIAPADKNTATQLREIERTVEREAGATIYAPTVRLWPGEQPESESWSFRRHPDLTVPSFQQQLDNGKRTAYEREKEGEPNEKRQPGSNDATVTGTNGDGIQPAGAGEFVNVDVQYAYSLLRRDGTTAVDVQPDRSRVAKFKETERHVTDRIDCLVLKLSHDLTEEGNPLYLIGDGSQKVDHFAVMTKETSLNDDLVTAPYGNPLLFENVLVLWNDDEQAYNLVVDEETIIDRVPP